MKTILDNPFAVFGLTPAIVKQLSNERLQELIDSIYRQLAKSYHPDQGGSEDNMSQLAAAKQQLDLINNPAAFTYFKKLYNNKNVGSKIKQQFINQQQQYQHIEKALQQFWSAFVSPSIQPLSVFTLPACLRLLLYDSLAGTLYGRRHAWISTKELDQHHFELEVTPTTLRRYELAKIDFRGTPPPTIPAEFIQQRSGNNCAYYWQRQVESETVISGKVIGCLNGWTEPHDLHEQVRTLIPVREAMAANLNTLQQGFSWSEFLKVVPYMQPLLDYSGLVVLVTPEQRFRILGRIARIHLCP